MTLKHVFMLAVAALAAAFAWRYHDAEVVTRFLHPDTTKPKPIQFDNGTVRQYRIASQPDGVRQEAQLPVGSLRKCWKGAEVVYTNFSCPRGFKERPVAATVNVVSGQATTRPATREAGTPVKSSLHDALDLSQDPHLREKIIERAVESQGRPPGP
jgi:hypothetical protein